MKDGIISFKFKSEKQFDSIKFCSDYICLSDLKRRVEEKRMRKISIFDPLGSFSMEGGKKRESYELLFYDCINNKSTLPC